MLNRHTGSSDKNKKKSQRFLTECEDHNVNDNEYDYNRDYDYDYEPKDYSVLALIIGSVFGSGLAFLLFHLHVLDGILGISR